MNKKEQSRISNILAKAEVAALFEYGAHMSSTKFDTNGKFGLVIKAKDGLCIEKGPN